MNFLKNTSLFLISFILLFAVGEMICRLWITPQGQVVRKITPQETDGKRKKLVTRGNPDSLYYYTPSGGVRMAPNADILVKNQQLNGRDVQVKTNSLGFRADEVPPEKNGEFRILVLGDSVTLSDSVDQDETYSAILEY